MPDCPFSFPLPLLGITFKANKWAEGGAINCKSFSLIPRLAQYCRFSLLAKFNFAIICNLGEYCFYFNIVHTHTNILYTHTYCKFSIILPDPTPYRYAWASASSVAGLLPATVSCRVSTVAKKTTIPATDTSHTLSLCLFHTRTSQTRSLCPTQLFTVDYLCSLDFHLPLT